MTVLPSINQILERLLSLFSFLRYIYGLNGLDFLRLLLYRSNLRWSRIIFLYLFSGIIHKNPLAFTETINIYRWDPLPQFNYWPRGFEGCLDPLLYPVNSDVVYSGLLNIAEVFCFTGKIGHLLLVFSRKLNGLVYSTASTIELSFALACPHGSTL